MGELIAFVSGKGGTGKTTVCAGVATALAMSGKKVLCMDCDVGLRNLDIALAMSDCGAVSFLEVAWGEYDLSDAAKHPLYSTLSFLTAPVRCTANQIPVKKVEKLLQQARKEFDYVLLDAPAGLEAGFRMAARYSDRIVLVTGADPASIRDASRAGQELRAMGKNNIRIVVNRVDPRILYDMELTVDSNVLFAAVFQEPLLEYTRKGAAAACNRIAGRIKGISVKIPL